MFRAFEVLLIALILGASVYTFHIKDQSEDRLAEIKRLQTEIRDHRDTIDLLEADWSLLNQPSRVQKLIQAFQEQLQLQTTEAQQIVSASELPRIRPEPDPNEDPIADAIMTGSVD